MVSLKGRHRGGQSLRAVRGSFYSNGFRNLAVGGAALGIILLGTFGDATPASSPQPPSILTYSHPHVNHKSKPKKPASQSGQGVLASLSNSAKPPASAISAASTSAALGIAAGSSLPGMSSANLNATLNGIAAMGAKWLRFDFDWSQIQPNNSQTYNWGPYDAVVAGAAARHLSVLGIIDYTPAWARVGGCGDNKCEPASAAQYAQFAHAVAARYAGTVHDWEIWNEPNNPGFWQPTPNPGDYSSLLKASYGAIHSVAANEEVITAGLSPAATTSTSYSPYDFLKAVYADGSEPYFDAVGDHPYTFPLSPAANADDAWTQMAGPGNSLRSLMVMNGDSAKKIWITEFGAPTGGPGPVATLSNPNLSASPYVVDPALQAQILSDALALYRSYNWAGPFFYYTYQDSGTDPSTNENFFGLITYGGTPKPAYTIFKQAATD